MKLVVCVLLALIALSNAAGSEDEFDYSNGPKGEANWGNLKEEWRTCNTGRTQSPVDIRSEDLQPVCSLRLLQGRYKPTNATLTNLDHDIALEFAEDSGTLIIDGVVYKLSEYHIHSPSEHTLHGKHYPVEGHLVHKTDDGKIAVVGVLYTIGTEDDIFIDQVEHFLPSLSGEEKVHVVDPSKLNINGKRFFRYAGSLTTPPCTEQVTWSVLRKPRTLSQKQYNLLQDALHGPNNRSTQPLNGRTIRYHK